MMTTIAAMLGACRWRSDGARAAKRRRPLGLTVVGGLFFSQL